MKMNTINNLQFEPTVKRISLNAIFAGIVVSFSIMSLLNLFGLGIGSILLDPSSEGSLSLGAGTVMWIIITGVLSLFAGGWVAGRLSPNLLPFESALHGMMVWGISMFISFFLIASSVSLVVGGASSMIGSSLSAVGKGAAAIGQETVSFGPKAVETAKSLFPDQMATLKQIQEQANEVLEKAQHKMHEAQQSLQNDQSSKKLQKQLGTLVSDYFSDDKAPDSAAKKEKAEAALVEFLVENTNVTEEQAQATVGKWEQQYKELKEKAAQKLKEAKQKVAEATDQATTIAGKISLSVFFLLVLQAIAAVVGGMMGAKSKRV
jgi:hypothetical protein